jgi:hypothetical protein
MTVSSKILISICITTLLIGAGFLWWIFAATQPAPSASQNKPSSTTSNIYTQNTSGVTVFNQPTTETPSISLEEEYAKLYTKILAKQISFISVDSIVGEAGGVYALFADDIVEAKAAFPAAKRFSLSIALIDINGDKTAEALVLEDLPGYCGTTGCPFYIYKKDKGRWSLLFDTLTSPYSALADSYTNDYADLFLMVSTGDSVPTVSRFTWDGKKYTPWEVMATWDGNAFTVVNH